MPHVPPNRPEHAPTRSLAAVAQQIPGADVRGDATVTGLALATGDVAPGDLFLALPGERSHGARFVSQALADGARAVLTDRAGAELIDPGIPRVVVEDPKRVLGVLSSWFYGHPARSMRTIGVTGTQGKTSVAAIIEAGAGIASAGRIGTGGSRARGSFVPSALTTPQAPQMQGVLARMREVGVETVAVEVSSHALDQARTGGLLFDAGVFLNLGHDHRDYHVTQEAYYRAKRELLTPRSSRRAVVNVDDQAGRRMTGEIELPSVTYSIDGRPADWSARDIQLADGVTRFTVVGPEGREYAFQTSLVGRFNVSNTLAAIAALAETGVAPEEVAPRLAGYRGVDGRMQELPCDLGFRVFIDSAHKPEAINRALGALRPMVSGRLLTIAGSNGNRDPYKRRLMGRLTATASDVLFVTDDDPEHEDPAVIRAAMLDGARSTAAELHEYDDRREAIREAIRIARPGDVVAVIGKGYDRFHRVAGGVVLDFDEPAIVAEALSERRDGTL